MEIISVDEDFKWFLMAGLSINNQGESYE